MKTKNNKMKGGKKMKEKTKKFIKDKKGVFGLTSVQAFFAIILGVALLAYVIVVIMGTLSSSTIIPLLSTSVVNESGSIATAGYTLAGASIRGFSLTTISATNLTGTFYVIPSANYTVNAAGVVTNATPTTYTGAAFSYTYGYYSSATNQLNQITGNTSVGITAFFGAINPVYSILAILVIILVLVVLVRVVTGGVGTGSSREASVPL
jgi:hypothetical protein